MFFLKDSAIDFDGNFDECKRLYTGQVISFCESFLENIFFL